MQCWYPLRRYYSRLRKQILFRSQLAGERQFACVRTTFRRDTRATKVEDGCAVRINQLHMISVSIYIELCLVGRICRYLSISHYDYGQRVATIIPCSKMPCVRLPIAPPSYFQVAAVNLGSLFSGKIAFSSIPWTESSPGGSLCSTVCAKTEVRSTSPPKYRLRSPENERWDESKDVAHQVPYKNEWLAR